MESHRCGLLFHFLALDFKNQDFELFKKHRMPPLHGPPHGPPPWTTPPWTPPPWTPHFSQFFFQFWTTGAPFYIFFLLLYYCAPPLIVPRFSTKRHYKWGGGGVVCFRSRVKIFPPKKKSVPLRGAILSIMCF